jgi:hypothetical protein
VNTPQKVMLSPSRRLTSIVETSYATSGPVTAITDLPAHCPMGRLPLYSVTCAPGEAGAIQPVEDRHR